MKKLLTFILLLFIPFIVLAETSNIEIKSIDLVDKSPNVTELDKVSFDNLKLKFNLSFTRLNDYAKYEIILKNNSSKDYEIDNTTVYNEGKYIKYEYLLTNNNKILKANEELTLYINITYDKEIDSSKFVDNKYTETSNVLLELTNDDKVTIVNPKTSTSWIIVIIITVFLLSILVIISIKNNKVREFYYVSLLLITMIPCLVFALEKLKIEIETQIVIDISCPYKLVTDMGSFSNTKDIKEICTDIIDDGYEYNSYIETPTASASSNIYLFINIENFKENSYLKIINNTTNEVLFTYDYNSIPKDRISLEKVFFVPESDIMVKNLVEYDGIDYRIEASDDLPYDTYHISDYETIIDPIKGPWITDKNIIDSIHILNNNLLPKGYYLSGFIIDENNPSIYHAIVEENKGK